MQRSYVDIKFTSANAALTPAENFLSAASRGIPRICRHSASVSAKTLMLKTANRSGL